MWPQHRVCVGRGGGWSAWPEVGLNVTVACAAGKWGRSLRGTDWGPRTRETKKRCDQTPPRGEK